MTIYKRLSVVEREAIKSGIILGKSQSDIAKQLNRDKATISRELRRMGLSKECYSPMAADAETKKKQSSRKAGKRKIQGALADQIENYLLEKHFSPEQISQMLRRQRQNDPSMQASYEAIYQYIYSQKTEFKRRALIKCLRRRKKCRRRR
jgi:IS30 family transposase